MEKTYPPPDFDKYPWEVTGEHPATRAARLRAWRQHEIDELSCIFGTGVKHSAIEATQRMPLFLSPYMSRHEPIIGIDRIFGKYLEAQAEMFMMRITGMAIAQRIARAEESVKDQMGKTLSGTYYIPHDKPISEQQAELIMAKQQLEVFQCLIKGVESELAEAQKKFENAMTVCEKKMMEQRLNKQFG